MSGENGGWQCGAIVFIWRKKKKTGAAMKKAEA